MKRIKRLILTCLSSQLILATAVAPVWAQPDDGGDDNGTVPNQADTNPGDGDTGDTGNQTDTPPADSSSSDSQTEAPQTPSTESSSESSQASTESTQKSTESTQNTPAPVYPQPIYPPAPNDVDHSSPAISITDPKPEESTEVGTDLDWQAIVEDSLQDPVFARAFADYQYALDTYNFDQMDPMNSLLSDVQADFETHLIEADPVEAETTEASAEPTITNGVQTPGELEEKGAYSLLTYRYGQDSPAPVRLQFVFAQSGLQGISLVQEVEAESRAIDESQASQLSSGETMVEDLADMNLPVVGISHHVDQGLALDTIVVPHVRDEAQDYMWLNVIGGLVSTASSPATEENQDLSQQMTTFLSGNEDDLTSDTSEESEMNSDESLMDESSDESSFEDESNAMKSDSMSEESQAAETVDQSGHPILSQVPLDFAYDEGKLLGMGSLRQGYETMMEQIKAGQELNRDSVQSLLGQPTVESEAGSSTTQKYLAIADDKVLFVQVISESASGKIQEIKTDNRTARLFDAFPVTVNGLYTLVEDNPQIYNKVSEKLGEPTIIEFKPEAQQIRYVWTSFEDKAMKNIEVVQDLDTQRYDLIYYKP